MWGVVTDAQKHLGGLAMRFVAIVALSTLLFGSQALAADAPPTMADIQQDFDAQKYQDVLKKVAQAITLSNKPGSEFDKAKLFELKGESHLRLKQQAPASEAF